MNVRKKDLKAIIRTPWRIGTFDSHIQEGAVYMAKRLLSGKPLLKWDEKGNPNF